MTATTHSIMGYCLSRLALALIKSRELTSALNSALFLANAFTHHFTLKLGRAHARSWQASAVCLFGIAVRARLTRSAGGGWWPWQHCRCSWPVGHGEAASAPGGSVAWVGIKKRGQWVAGGELSAQPMQALGWAMKGSAGE